MLKQFFSILMLVVILLPGFSKFWIIIAFKINQDFIVNEWCINKEDVIITCNGKCYLSSRLNLVDENEQKQIPKPKIDSLKINYHLTKNEMPVFKFRAIKNRIEPVSDQVFYYCSHLDEVFRPPQPRDVFSNSARHVFCRA